MKPAPQEKNVQPSNNSITTLLILLVFMSHVFLAFLLLAKRSGLKGSEQPFAAASLKRLKISKKISSLTLMVNH